MGRTRTVAIGAAVVLAAAGVWVGMNWAYLRAWYAGRLMAVAATDDDRARRADEIIALGPTGHARLIALIRSGDDATRAAAVSAFGRFLSSLPESDSSAVGLSKPILEAIPASDVAKRPVLELASIVLKRTGNAFAGRCREMIAAGLKASDAETRALAVRLALHPDVKLRGELHPLLHDSDAHVRAAALVALAMSADGEKPLPDEELFQWLHDPDAGVRKVCYHALVTRDRSEVEINLGRRLTHPDPGERLKLLLDLRYEDEVPDAEPWLERLSRDREPAVRAAAARTVLEVAADHRQNCPGWVIRVCDADPDPTVRRVASCFRKELLGPAQEVRPASGP